MTPEWLFLMMLFAISDTISSGLLSGHFIRRDNRTSTLVGLIAFGYFARGAGELIGIALGYKVKPEPTDGLVFAILSTRILEAAILWLVYLHVIGVINLNPLFDRAFSLSCRRLWARMGRKQ